MKLIFLRSEFTSFPTLILIVLKPSSITLSSSSFISNSSSALNAVNSFNFIEDLFANIELFSIISIAVIIALEATLLKCEYDEITFFASITDFFKINFERTLANVHPPSLVSLLDPGEICCSPQPSFPFLSII